jgi:hypothetical protein
MGRRARAEDKELQELENEFRPLLLSCLRECAQGRWGLFGQNDSHPESKWLSWNEATRLKEIAVRIKLLRAPLGVSNETCERFLNLCSLRGPNAQGESRLAETLLRQLSFGRETEGPEGQGAE